MVTGVWAAGVRSTWVRVQWWLVANRSLAERPEMWQVGIVGVGLPAERQLGGHEGGALEPLGSAGAKSSTPQCCLVMKEPVGSVLWGWAAEWDPQGWG